VVIKDALHPLLDLLTLGQDGGQGIGRRRQHGVGGPGAGHHDGLLPERGHDVLDELVPDPGRVLAGDRGQPSASGGGQSVGAAEPGQQFQHGAGLYPWAEDPFQGGVDLGEQTPDPVGQPGGLGGEVVVVADQDGQLGQRLIGQVDPAQGARHRPGGLGDDVGVAGVGLGRARVQVGDAPHRQPGQVRDVRARGPRDGDRQRTDRGRLVDHDQHRATLQQRAEQGEQALLVLRQGLVEHPVPGPVQRDRVVGFLADVQPAEDRVLAVLRHPRPSFRDVYLLVAVSHRMPAATPARRPSRSDTNSSSPRSAGSLSAVHRCTRPR